MSLAVSSSAQPTFPIAAELALQKAGLTVNGTSHLSGERHVNTEWHVRI